MTSLQSFSSTSPLVLIGAGKMGGALLSGWLKRGLPASAMRVVDPAPPPNSAALLAAAGITVLPAAAGVTAAARVLVVAVKPQMIATILPSLRSLIGTGTIAVSIAAGTTMATLSSGLGSKAVIRAMPNTPAQVGRGITVAVAGEAVDPEGKRLVTALLEAVGDVAWVEDEALIDAVTAVSGSGPAYVFLLAECLAEAAIAAGLPAELAARLARATVTGAGELLYQSELSPKTLRENVTSPKGTTAAALSVLMADDGLGPLLKKAVAEAKRRSKELAG